MSEKTQMREVTSWKETQIPNDLVAGATLYTDGICRIELPGEYERGELMMETGTGWEQATPEGLQTCKDACILGRSFELGEDEYTQAPCYYCGRFMMRKIRVNGHKLSDLDGPEQFQVMDCLRRKRIMLV